MAETKINIADLKVGDVFETHSGAKFRVLAKQAPIYISNKKSFVNFCKNLQTGRLLTIDNFKNTIIFMKNEK